MPNNSGRGLDPSLLELAEALFRAGVTKTPIPPISEGRELSIADAYAIQLHVADMHKGRGRRVVGRKVGLTSQAMQQMLGVDEPDFGHLFDDQWLPDGATLGRGDFVAPRAEPEIAVRLKADLRGPGVTVDDVRDAVDEVYPALEIIDSRIADWKITIIDTIADNASGAAFVLGAPAAWRDVDLAALECRMIVNGEVVDSGVGAAVLGHPFEPVAWLANVLADYDAHLSAGDIVLPGSITKAVPAQPGDEFRADFGVLGSVGMSLEPVAA